MARGSRTVATWTSQQYERLCTNLRARAKLSPIHRCFFSFYSFSSPIFLLLPLFRLSTLLYLLFHLSFTVSHFAAFRSSSFVSEGTPVRAYARALSLTHTHTHTHTKREVSPPRYGLYFIAYVCILAMANWVFRKQRPFHELFNTAPVSIHLRR